MEKYLVADSYAKFDQIGEPYLKSGKQYIEIAMCCPRCGGSGIYGPININDGKCFRCGGSGTEHKEVRVYTDKEYAALQRQKERAKEKREEERARMIAEGEAYRHEAIMKFGFGEDEKAYIVCGDTYAIKDQLKAMGARYNGILKWYFSTSDVELPEGYFLCPISFDEVYTYTPISKYIDFHSESVKVVKEKMAAARAAIQPTSYYPAEVKDRLRDLEVTFMGWHSFAGSYGTTFVYTFSLGEYTFVWMSTKLLPECQCQEGQKLLLTGTVKSFDEYEGIKTTYLTRCVVKEII